MAVVAAHFAFQVTSSDSSGKAISSLVWSDAGSHTPQALIFFGSRQTGTSHAYTCDGMTDGTSQACISTGVLDNSTTSAGSRRYMANDRVLAFVGPDGTTHGAFALTSLDTDGFTLSTTTTPAFTFEVRGVALAGLDNVKLDIFQVPAVGVAQFSRTGIGFKPDCNLYMAALIGSLGSTGSATSVRTLGWSLEDGTQAAVGMRVLGSGGAVFDNYTSSTIATDRVLYNVTAAGSPNGHDMACVSHDADGYTLDAILNQNGLYMATLCMKGGVWKAGTITAASSTGASDVTTTGCDPVAVLMRSSTISTASRSSPFEGGALSVGAATAAAQSAQHIMSANRETIGGGSPTEEYTNVDDTALWTHYERTGADTQTVAGEISLTSLGTGKFTINQDTADPTAVLIGWLAVGNAPSGGGGGGNAPRSMHYQLTGMR